jgi:hypothetical protein
VIHCYIIARRTSSSAAEPNLDFHAASGTIGAPGARTMTRTSTPKSVKASLTTSRKPSAV